MQIFCMNNSPAGVLFSSVLPHVIASEATKLSEAKSRVAGQSPPPSLRAKRSNLLIDIRCLLSPAVRLPRVLACPVHSPAPGVRPPRALFAGFRGCGAPGPRNEPATKNLFTIYASSNPWFTR